MDRPKSGDFTGVAENSVFASLLGKFDGKTKWDRLRCFSCGDLFSEPEYRNSRGDDWKGWYRSTIAFPLRVSDDATIGFLAFDSPDPGFFGKLPNAFAYRGKAAEYHDLLEQCTVYHLGGMIADMLALTIEHQKQDIIDYVAAPEKEIA